MFLTLPLIALARQRVATGWLGLFVLSLSLLSLSDYLRSSGFYQRFPQLWGFCDWPLATIGTFYYLYVRALTRLGNGQRQCWHALPLGCWLLLVLQARSGVTPWIPLGLFLLAFQMVALAYALAVLYRLREYRRRVRENYSSTKQRDLAWLVWLTVVILALLTLWLPATLLGEPGTWALIVGRLAVLFFVGWYGLRQAAVFLPPAPRLELELEPQMPAVAVDYAPAPAAAPAPQPPGQAALDKDAARSDKYARSGMTPAAQQLIGERLAWRAQNTDDQRDSDVKLSDLAERIGTSPQLLSQYLNDVLGVNFFDYINGLRIAQVQIAMAAPASAGLPLLELAFGAGFNSRSTFNAAFKKMTGMAPSAWRKLHVPMSGPVGQDD